MKVAPNVGCVLLLGHHVLALCEKLSSQPAKFAPHIIGHEDERVLVNPVSEAYGIAKDLYELGPSKFAEALAVKD